MTLQRQPPIRSPLATGSASPSSVERGNTPADALSIMYDHPNYPTRIEVDTNTPIDGG